MNAHHQDHTNESILHVDVFETNACYTTGTTAGSSLIKETRLFTNRSLLSTYRVPRQRRQKVNPDHYAKGLWTEKEQHQFLTGLMVYGWGQWKEIGTIITTRYVIVERTHHFV